MKITNPIFKTTLFAFVGLLVTAPAFAHSDQVSHKHSYKSDKHRYYHQQHHDEWRDRRARTNHWYRHHGDEYRDRYYHHRNRNWNGRDWGYSDRNRHDHRRYHEERRHVKPVNACVPIKVVSRGGIGGFRTTDRIKDFKRIQSSAYHGKLCGKRTVEIELSKMDPRTKTVLFIGDQKYVFSPYEHADRYVNNWYRKYIKVNLNHFYPRAYSKAARGRFVEQLHRNNHKPWRYY